MDTASKRPPSAARFSTRDGGQRHRQTHGDVSPGLPVSKTPHAGRARFSKLTHFCRFCPFCGHRVQETAIRRALLNARWGPSDAADSRGRVPWLARVENAPRWPRPLLEADALLQILPISLTPHPRDRHPPRASQREMGANVTGRLTATCPLACPCRKRPTLAAPASRS